MSGAAMLLMGLVAGSGMAVPAAAQELADFDYINLSLRGIGFEAGYLPGYRIHGVRGETRSWGARLDLGYLGPGLRISPSVTYWSSELETGELSRLETRLEQLIAREVGDAEPRAGPSSIWARSHGPIWSLASTPMSSGTCPSDG